MNMSLAVKATSWVCLVMLLLRVVCCDPLKHMKPNQLSYLTEPMKDPIKVNDCCMNVSNRQIQTPITSCKIQAPSHPCVHAVIFTSMGTEYCSSPRARWVRNKIVELKKKGNPCTEWKKRK